MKTWKIPGYWVFPLVCFAVLVSLLSIARAQCTRCGGSPPGSFVTLYNFKGPPDGADPVAGLVRDVSGNLYGTTSQGGVTGGACGNAGGCGVVFKLDTAGKETALHSFTGGPTDGANPSADLVQDAVGNLYGTTPGGGTSNAGTVFKVDTTGKETVLYSFTGRRTGQIL